MKAILKTRVADLHSFHPDPDPAFVAEYRSRSGFNDQKLKQITAEKK
jgi:hypothetical protein